MEFIIGIEANSPGTLFESDRALCIQYALENQREDLLKTLNVTEDEIAAATAAKRFRKKT
ncbi:MAG: hypothetical protein KR126chlam3_01065 [Chlamydiae bacterium]|nr:hypothetical protein [Chlamydiota bacterium]